MMNEQNQNVDKYDISCLEKIYSECAGSGKIFSYWR